MIIQEFHIYRNHSIIRFPGVKGYSIFTTDKTCVGHAPTITGAMAIIDIPDETPPPEEEGQED